MLSAIVTKAVNHCHSISSYPYFHINTKLVLCTGAAAHKRYQHILMLSVVAGVCHQVSSVDSTVLLVPPAPTLGVTPPTSAALQCWEGWTPQVLLIPRDLSSSRTGKISHPKWSETSLWCMGKLVTLAQLSQPPQGTSKIAVCLLLSTQVAKQPQRLGT